MSQKGPGSALDSFNVLADFNRQHRAFDAAGRFGGLPTIARQASAFDTMDRLSRQLTRPMSPDPTARSAAVLRSLSTSETIRALSSRHAITVTKYPGTASMSWHTAAAAAQVPSFTDTISRTAKQLSDVVAPFSASAATAALIRTLETKAALVSKQHRLEDFFTKYPGDLSGSLLAASRAHTDTASALARMPSFTDTISRNLRQLTPALIDPTALRAAVLRSLDLSASMKALTSHQDAIKTALETSAKAQAAWASDASSLQSTNAEWLRALGQTPAHRAEAAEQKARAGSEGGAEADSAGLSVEPMPDEHRQIDLGSTSIVGIGTLVLLQYAYMLIYSTATGRTYDDRAMLAELRWAWWLLSSDGPIWGAIERLEHAHAVIDFVLAVLLGNQMRRDDKDS